MTNKKTRQDDLSKVKVGVHSRYLKLFINKQLCLHILCHIRVFINIFLCIFKFYFMIEKRFTHL